MEKIFKFRLFSVGVCILFTVGTSAFGYGITGRVLDENGNGVSGATVYINCYPASGGALNDTDTSGTYGGYAGGWLGTSCHGEKVVVKAVKGNKSGTASLTASGLADVKNVTIKSSPFVNAELHCEPEPVDYAEPGMVKPVNVQFYMQLFAAPVNVNGGHVALRYDPTKMTCVSVEPVLPFEIIESFIDPGSGTVEVRASSTIGPVEVSTGENPLPFFVMQMEAGSFQPPGTKSHISLVSSEIDANIEGIQEPVSAFPGKSEVTLGEPEECKAYFLIDSMVEWEKTLYSQWPDPFIMPLPESEWHNYMSQWNDPDSEIEGEPYPETTFLPAELWVYEGGGSGGTDPCDAGLVMGWAEDNPDTGEYASAWRYDYGDDPDLRNSTITVTVTAPQLGVSGVQINAVSFAITDTMGRRRSWWWNVGTPPAPIQWNTPTTITINTANTGVSAAAPTATGYMNTAGFNLAQAQCFDVDENGSWVFNSVPVPPPGNQVFVGMWNYWHNLLVTRNVGGEEGVVSKWYVKYSQPPVVIDPDKEPPAISGWDEVSNYIQPPVMADDFPCYDDRPITDIHWWGSFKGWDQPEPPQLPDAFHIGIWTDFPDSDPDDPSTFSHPDTLIWENYCDNFVWNFAGYDVDPYGRPEYENEACFQFTQLLSEDEWFQQEPLEDPDQPNIYWLSIAPVWADGQQPVYPWGWKTREHIFQDDAVRIRDASIWPVRIGSGWTGGEPLEIKEQSWDLAFELTTNAPAPGEQPSADLTGDDWVDFEDFAIFADQWLTTGP